MTLSSTNLAPSFQMRSGPVKFCTIVLQVNRHRLTESDFDIISYSDFQDGGHDICPPLAAACSYSSIRRLPDSPPSVCDVIGSLYALIHRLIATIGPTTSFGFCLTDLPFP